MSSDAANKVTYKGDTAEARLVWAYRALEKHISELPEEQRNYVYLNVGEYANYLLRLFAKQNWQALIDDLTAEELASMKVSVTSLRDAVKNAEVANDESALCGTALRVIEANLELTGGTSTDSTATAEAIGTTIDHWIKLYNQMIYKGIADTRGVQ